ncbi:speckle-type POZ protein-like [Nasonia vitripennis]|uniref:Uncharacterized protein n=1 Tax=Nasonia vitripennis TaxID=7425 RepID=A0A7M7H5M0_NASVI|nr:speckle-type POZ protein-like [Nasonia vitripennis]
MNKPLVAAELGFTEQQIMISSYAWKIKNFRFINMPAGERLESPTFNLASDKTVDWYLALYPFGIDKAYKHCISASLGNKSKSTEKFSMDVSFSISVLDRKGQIVHKRSKNSVINSNSFNGFNEFLERHTLTAENSNMLINDVLTILCEFIVVGKTVNYSKQEYTKYSAAYNTISKRKVLLNDIECQLEADRFHDLTITAPCGTELHAHKFMLAARSPVFRAMFTVDMKEKANNAVKIEDITYNALKEMIRFMYTAKVENLDTCLDGVWMAAEKYQISGLKGECRDYLFDNLSIDNAVKTLTYCHQFQLNDLKALTHRFMTFHAKDIANTESFKSIDDPDLLMEIVQNLTLKS